MLLRLCLAFGRGGITFSADFCSFRGGGGLNRLGIMIVLLVLRDWEFLFLLWCRRDLFGGGGGARWWVCFCVVLGNFVVG